MEVEMWSYVYPTKSPQLIVSISCSVTLMISCLRNLIPSSSSMLFDDDSDIDDESFAFSSDDSFAFAMTLLPVRTVYFMTKVSMKIGFWIQGEVEILLEKFLVANIVVRMAPFNFRLALNFFRQSTVS